MEPHASDGRSESFSDAEAWLLRARQGSEAALGQLLEHYRGYLLSIANQELDPELQRKLGSSDIVQETFLKAQTEFAEFRGQTPGEWQGWLRTILRNQLADIRRHYQRTGKRRIRREVSLETAPQQGASLEDSGETPSHIAQDREEDEQLREALAQLPAPQQQLIHWRNFETLTFEEIGQRLGKSAEAARKLWARAVEHLGQRLDPPP